MSLELDCGDRSCYFAKDKTGMRTNGGCRCFSNAGFNTRSSVTAGIEMLPKYLELLQRVKILEDELQYYKYKEVRGNYD